jgi:hypothetical protein
MHVAGRGASLVAVAVTAVREKVHDVKLPRVARLRSAGFAFLASKGRGHRTQRRVKTWWASHELEAVLWALAVALAVLAGLVVAWL